MPLLEPKTGETQSKFISRCMSNDIMKKEFPDQTQRTGACFSQWKKNKGEKMEEKDVKRDEKGRIIVAENVPIIINGSIEIKK